MDSAVIRALCLELSRSLAGSKVRGLGQVDPWEFVIETTRGRLLVSCHPRLKRIALSGEPPTLVDSHFARTASDVLKGVNVRRIVQIDMDRIVEVEFSRKEEFEGACPAKLVVELVGASGNAVLVTQEKSIVAVLRKSKRHTPGDTYVPPKAPHWIDPGRVSRGELAEILRGEPCIPLAERIQKTVMGMSPLLSTEAVYRSGLEPDANAGACSLEELGALAATISRIHADIVSDRFEPTVYWDVEPVELSCFRLDHLKSLRKTGYGSMNEAVVFFYSRLVDRERLEERKARCSRAIQAKISSLEKALERQKSQAQEAHAFEKYRAMGDAILVNLGSIKRGTSVVRLEDPRKPDAVLEIPLVPGKTPQDAAQKYFKRYKKGKRALPLLKEKMERTRSAIAAFEKLRADAEAAETVQDAERCAGMLLQKGILQGPKPKKGRAVKQYRTFITSGGWEVVVGRSGEENEEITFHVARPTDLFFHASGVPGSHTVMKVTGKASAPSRKDVEEAAGIAAYYSKARTSRLVPVAYAERRYVKKARKAPAGTVIVEREKVVMVEPRKPR